MAIKEQDSEAIEDKDMKEYIKKQQKKMQMRTTMRENNAQTQLLKNLEKLKSRLDIYQGQSAGEALTLTDFHKMTEASQVATTAQKVLKLEVQLTE